MKVRRGCGWSSSPVVTTNRSDLVERRRSREERRGVPVGTEPEVHERRSGGLIGRARRTRPPLLRASRRVVHRVDRAGLDLVEERDARHALVGVRVVHGDPALVAEEHVDGVPVDVGGRQQLVALPGRARRRRVRSTRAPSRRRAPRTPAERCRLFAPLRAPGDDTAMDRATVEVYEEGAARWRDTRPARFIELAEVIGRAGRGRNPARRPRLRGRAAPAGARRPGRRARRGVRDGRARARVRAGLMADPGGSRAPPVPARRDRWLVGTRELSPRARGRASRGR